MQPEQGYRAAIDPVFLAAACPAAPDKHAHILELGSGTGAASLCLASRLAMCEVTGVELQASACALANESALLNGFGDRVRFMQGDVLDLPDSLAPQSFDHLIANPPFYESADYSPSAADEKTRSHSMAAGDLAHWVKAARRYLKPQGTLTFVLAIRQIPEALSLIAGRGFGGMELVPLWPRRDENAKRALVVARDQSRAPFVLHAGLFLHEAGGTYTSQARAVLEDAKSLADALRLRDT